MSISQVNTPLANVKKVLILADESSVWKIGGLFQLDRILLNCTESLQGSNETSSPHPIQFFIAWKQKSNKKNNLLFKHPKLKNIHIETNDDAKPTDRWFHENEHPVLVIKTNLLLGRKSLRHSPHTLLIKEFDLRQDMLTGKDNWWDKLSQTIDDTKDKNHPTDNDCGFSEQVKNDSDIKSSEKRLFRSLSKPTDGLVSTHLNRPISTRISRLLASTPITPNQWTYLLFGITLSGLWTLTWGSQAGFIVGTFFYQMVSLLDGCDGELARVRFEESEQGEWTDTISDLAGNILFLFALGLGLSHQQGIGLAESRFFFLEGTICAVALAATLWAVHQFTQKRESSGHFNNFGNTIIQELQITGWTQKISSFIAKILKRDSYILIFFIMSICGATPWILHAMGAGILIHLIVLIQSLIFVPAQSKILSQQENEP